MILFILNHTFKKKNHSHARFLSPHDHKELPVSPEASRQGESQAFSREEIRYWPLVVCIIVTDAVLPFGDNTFPLPPSLMSGLAK